MSRVLDAVRESFIAVARDPWLAAPAAALVLFNFVAIEAYTTLAGRELAGSAITYLIGSFAAAAAACAYAVRLEPYARPRAAVLTLFFVLPALVVGIVNVAVVTGAMRLPPSHALSNMLSGYGHLEMIARGLLVAVAARAVEPLAEGDGALASLREAFDDVRAGFWLFALLSALHWLLRHMVAGGLPWPIGPFLGGLLFHTLLIGGARRL